MQRLLFYVITAFVFLLRSYDWLIAVGMTFVLTYASAACIHAFLLSTLQGIGPDSDVLALQGIMMSTTIALFCYSLASRRISKYAIAPLFYTWFSAMLVSSLAMFFSTNGIMGNLANSIVPAGCSADGKCNPSACSNATSHGLFRSEMDQLVPMALEQWMYYNASRLDGYNPNHELCLDCHGVYHSNELTVVNLRAKTPLHYMDVGYYYLISAFVLTRLAVRPLLFNPSKSRNVLFFYLLIEFKILKPLCYPRAGLLVITLNPLMILWSSRNGIIGAQKDYESILFCGLSTASKVKAWHINVAKLLASCWFVCSWLARIIMLVLPVVTVTLAELGSARLLESEAPWLVGQWAPFVYVGLALLASLILKLFHHGRDGAPEQRRLICLSYPDSTEPLQSLLRRFTEKYERDLLLSPCLIVKEFEIWWKDPVNVAKQDYKDVHRQIWFEDEVPASRRAVKRQRKLSHVGKDEAAQSADAEPVERLEFDQIWERLLASASESQDHRNWSTQIPSTFAICRGDNQPNSLVETGWITATYEEEEYEPISRAEMKRRAAKALNDRRDREQLADSLEIFIGDVLELGGFELREA